MGNVKDHQHKYPVEPFGQSFTTHVCLSSGAWIPSVQSTSEYLQIDLLQVRNISVIMTQGRDEAECGCSEWVTEYTLSYSLCGSFWSDYKANGSIKVASIHQYFCTCRQRFYQHLNITIVILMSPVSGRSCMQKRVKATKLFI